MSTYLTYDGSFTGLMTVVYDIFLYKIESPIVQSRFIKDLNLYNDLEIITCEDKAMKTLKYLRMHISKDEIDLIKKTFLSEKKNAEQLIVSVLQQSIKQKSSILNDYSNPNVLAIHKIVKSVDREKHRMKAFVRFREIENNFFYAECHPDFDVLPLIVEHFTTRYADQKWIIYDLKRNYGIFYDLAQVEYIFLKKNRTDALGQKIDDVFNYEKLWSTYFGKTNIESRKNSKLFLQHVPKRYWKHLIELR